MTFNLWAKIGIRSDAVTLFNELHFELSNGRWSVAELKNNSDLRVEFRHPATSEGLIVQSIYSIPSKGIAYCVERRTSPHSGTQVQYAFCSVNKNLEMQRNFAAGIIIPFENKAWGSTLFEERGLSRRVAKEVRDKVSRPLVDAMREFKRNVKHSNENSIMLELNETH